jgi:ceramide glucosyltransferase
VHFVRVTAEVVLALLAVCGMGYYCLCMLGAMKFARVRQKEVAESSLPVSFLKPLRGSDREMYESFRSHCLQNYPGEWEFIFGVMEADDPAVADVDRLCREFPERSIRLVVCPRKLGTNLKVSNLIQMLPHARYEHIIINDSDIRVEPDYLERVMAPFADPRVGMVTALYRGEAGKTLGSKLEAVGISTDFHAGALAALVIEGGIHFAFGSTLAISRKALEAIGGLEPLVDYLADDYELGYRVSQQGLRVDLASSVVDTFLPEYRMRDFADHQLRWGRSTRDSRPAGYLGLALTFGVPWALLAAIVAGFASWSILLLVAALGVRYAVVWSVGWGILGDAQLRRLWPLVPIRDVAALVLWVLSLTGRTIVWRGDEFVLEKGRLRPLEE